jgi:cobalt-zinc-cadmium efflux system outer membrane protein
MWSRAPLRACAAACALALPSFALAQERRASEVVDQIVREGPRAAAIRAEADVVRREQSARLSWPNPTVAFSQEGAGFTQFLQVEQALPIFGIRGALTGARDAAQAAAEADRDARLWQLRADAASAVARLVAGQQRADAGAATVTVAERLVDVLRVREREGEGSRFDRLRAEQELAELRQEATDAAVAAVAARSAVAVLLPAGVSLARVVDDAPPPGPPPSLERLAALAREKRPELRSIHQSAERTRIEVDVARRARRPQPLVSGGVKRAGDGAARETGGVFGLAVALPLFDSGNLEAARWTSEGLRIDAERSALDQQIRAEVAGASDVLLLRQRALSAARDESGPDELMATAEVAYREGEVGILVWLDAVRAASRARQRALAVRLDVRLAQIALERAVGEILWP